MRDQSFMTSACLFLCWVLSCDALSIFPQKAPPTSVKKVAIIGSGIAGLSLAHALENSEECAKPYLKQAQRSDNSKSAFGVETHLFDSRPSINFLSGAGIQLTGGLACLKKINPQVYRSVANTGLPLKKIKSRAKPWFGDEPYSTLLELDIEKEIKKSGGQVEEGLIVDGEVMATCIMRSALQEILLDTLPQETSKRVNFGKCLSGMKGDSSGIICQFSDGTEEGPFDMVVGGDGINSVVKEYIETGDISKEGKKLDAIYSGIRIQYAVADSNEGDEEINSSELCQYFGDGAYGLGGIYGSGQGRKRTKGAFLIFRDPDYIGPFKKKEVVGTVVSENADWTQDVESVGSLMSKRISETGVPKIQLGPIIEESDRFFELGVYFHNPFSFKGWSRKVQGSGERYAVLCGDAAHAMPPFLGQGSNQAIQDSYSLACKIFEHNANLIPTSAAQLETGDDIKSLRALLKEYENTRWFATTSITLKAAFIGYLETGGEGFFSKFRDVFFTVAGKAGIARKVFLGSATPKV